MSGAITAVVGATVVGGYLGGKGASDAADTSAAASRYAADLQQRQYEQSRDDLAPYREAGYSNLGELDQYGRSQVNQGDYIPNSQIPQYQGSTIGQMPGVDQNVSDFGYSGNIPQYNVDQRVNQFNVQGNIPKYDRSVVGDMPEVQGKLPEYNVRGEIPEYDQMDFDLYKDPSYEWRKAEQDRGIDRAMAGMGKTVSGNRLNEIMERSGQMASQEYGAARSRYVQDYDIGRQNEQTQFGRDLTEYDANRSNALTQYGFDSDTYNLSYGRDVDQYGRDLTAYGQDRSGETDQYGRDITAYDANTAINQEQYGRANYAYGQDLNREAQQYGRATGEYGMTRSAEDARYGRDTDAYNRAYGQDVDQYGRDLTTYNANVAQEQGMYGRGVSDYGRAYQQEGDYLNRLAALSNIGQSATNTGVTAGGQSAAYQGSAIQAAGNAQAAGTIGQANAWTGAIGDATSLYAMSQYGGGMPIQSTYNNFSASGPVMPPNYVP